MYRKVNLNRRGVWTPGYCCPLGAPRSRVARPWVAKPPLPHFSPTDDSPGSASFVGPGKRVLRLSLTCSRQIKESPRGSAAALTASGGPWLARSPGRHSDRARLPSANGLTIRESPGLERFLVLRTAWPWAYSPISPSQRIDPSSLGEPPVPGLVRTFSPSR